MHPAERPKECREHGDAIAERVRNSEEHRLEHAGQRERAERRTDHPRDERVSGAADADAEKSDREDDAEGEDGAS